MYEILDPNFDIIVFTCRKHIEAIKGRKRQMRQMEVERVHSSSFHEWFREHVG